MRKSSLLIACMFLLGILMSGCSGHIKQTGNQKGTDNNKVVTLKMMGWEASPLETKSVKNGLAEFMKMNPNIKVEYTTVPGSNYASKLMTMLAGNAAPDVFFAGTDLYRKLATEGQLLDITDYFKNSEYKEDDFLPGTMRLMKVNGRLYGIISCIVGPELFYNKDLFDKAGLPYPPSDPNKAWTWDQFRDVAKKLTIKQGNKVIQYGAYGFEQQYVTTALLMENGVKIFNDNYDKMIINTPEAREVFQAVLNLRKVDNAAPDATTLEMVGMQPHQMLETGKVAMLADGSWSLQELSQMNFRVGVGVLPKFKYSTTHVQAHMHAAWAKTKHPEEAWKLISFLSSDQYQIQNVKEGLWLPDRKSLYTEEGMKKWYSDKVYGESFKPMINWFINADVYPYAMLTHNKVNDIYTEVTDQFWHNNKDINSVLSELEKRVNEELAKKD
ncbi:ABC transporter substrate-binding protein [Caldanaerobius polysaccharolyticus]|uniref:ABC transporter substrate-binding protein n=1 Tax=Caldanaerobius polysaccharolyticus TaxID=44256 RepID=UPI00047EC1EE|nr:sugar ABC transporter substrate-binding protein [Caldanaerobius polysaccharolyticus]